MRLATEARTGEYDAPGCSLSISPFGHFWSEGEFGTLMCVWRTRIFLLSCVCCFLLFARTCLKRKSEKTKIARPKINKQKCPPCGRTSNYRKSWAPRPQQLETPRLQKKSLSPTLVQPTSWHWYLSCIRACAKLRNTRGVFFACFVADCDGFLFADSCS